MTQQTFTLATHQCRNPSIKLMEIHELEFGPPKQKYAIVAKEPDGQLYSVILNEKGKRYTSSESCFDLVPIPKKEYWSKYQDIPYVGNLWIRWKNEQIVYRIDSLAPTHVIIGGKKYDWCVFEMCEWSYDLRVWKECIVSRKYGDLQCE